MVPGRARLLWGSTAVVVILWILATGGVEEDMGEDEPIKLAPSIQLADVDFGL